MSVEDINKINKLAQELLNHGLVASREDAVKRAEEMLNKKLADVESNVPSVNSDGSIKPSNDPDYYRNIIERTRDQIQRDMKNFSEMLTLLASEVDSIKEEIKNIKINNRPPEQDTKQEVEKELQEEVKEEQTEVIEENKAEEPHPKRGNFNSGDVAIEKMFYYGNKKQE